MPELSRRALLVSVAAASGARLIAPAAAQTDGAQAAAGAGAVRLSTTSSSAPANLPRPPTTPIPPLPDGLANLDFDAWRDIRFKSDKALLRRAQRQFPPRALPSRPSLQAARRHQRAARRHSGADPLCGESVGLWTQQGRRKSADQSRLRRLPPALPDQRAACLGRGRFVSRRELFPLSRPRPALRPLRAGSCDRRRPGLNEEFPFFREFWIETPDADGRAHRHLRSARRRVGDRRLPLRPRAGPGDQDRDQRDAVRPQGDSGARARAALLDVLRRQERPPLRRRFPRRTARFRRAAHAYRRRRMDLAAAQQSGRARESRPSSTTIRAASASCSATAISATTRISNSPTS